MTDVPEVPAARTADPAPPSASTLPALVEAVAAADPDREAVVAGATRLTYGELAARVRSAASALAALGVSQGEVVGLLASNRAEWVVAAVAAMRCGARVDAFNTWSRAHELEFLLASSGASVLVVADRVRSTDLLAELRTLVPEVDEPGPSRSARFPGLRHVVVLGSDDAAGSVEGALPAGTVDWHRLTGATGATGAGGAGEPVAEPPGRGSAPAFVLYTSGSTSTPKAVPLCHRDLVVNGFHIGERMGLDAASRVWLGSPLFWSYGCANALMATFTHGATLVLEEHFTARGAAETFARERVTAAYLLPTMIDALVTEVAADVRAVASLRTGLTIGRPDVVDRAATDLGIAGICNIYGSTETYGNCCVTDHRWPLARRRSTQGRPLPGVEVRVVDADGAAVPTGEPGEALVRGRLTPGYLTDDAANATAFVEEGGRRWFRTGDRLRIDADGAVAFVDRTHDMIKTSGINVSPAEVEGFLAGHAGVREVLVVGAPHPTRDEVVVAFVVSDDPALTGAEIVRHAKANIAGYKVPWLVELVDDLPRTATGKITRRALRERAARLVADELAATGAGR